MYVQLRERSRTHSNILQMFSIEIAKTSSRATPQLLINQTKVNKLNKKTK